MTAIDTKTMNQSPVDAGPMKMLADRYAAELTAQYRTLNLFAQHAGEIGRAHEVFLRAVLQRFLPGRLKCATGFVANATRVSKQQDIIVFNTIALPILFEVGDCVVVDASSVSAVVEVKTSLDSVGRLDAALLHLSSSPTHGFFGLYAWEGLALETVLDHLWGKYRAAANLAVSVIPSAVYVREKYLLFPNWDGRRDTPPLRVLRMDDGHSEGEALLTFVSRMWISGLQNRVEWPWWVSEWYARQSEICDFVDWPSDLKDRALREQANPK